MMRKRLLVIEIVAHPVISIVTAATEAGVIETVVGAGAAEIVMIVGLVMIIEAETVVIEAAGIDTRNVLLSNHNNCNLLLLKRTLPKQCRRRCLSQGRSLSPKQAISDLVSYTNHRPSISTQHLPY